MLNPLHNQYNPEELWALDRDHFLHPWTHFESFKDEGSLVLAKGQGCRVTDVSGKEYFDGIGGMWCVNVGYGRDELAQAMAQQASQLAYSNTFVDVSNAPAALLSGKLASMAPGNLNRVMYALTGSAANEGAVRLAQYYHARKGRTSRKHIISRKNSYHGSTLLTASLSFKETDRQNEFQYLTSFIHHLSAPYYYRAPVGMGEAEFTRFLIEEFKAKIAELGAENVSCFIAEPIQASGGVVPPPKGYLKGMIDVCREHDILYISDEVVTAFGRIGHMFASLDEFGIQPDIIVCAKGITSGYFPMGATLYSDEIHEVISTNNPDGWFSHGFTCAGHPVGCAVALKNIEIMEREDICGNVRNVGDYFEAQLLQLEELPLVGDVRGKRMMMCVEYVADKATKQHIPDEINISKRISNLCEERGLLVRPIGHLDIMSPPLTMTRDDADFLVETLRGAIVHVTDELVREGAL